jgi:hypothetical protein
MKYPNAAKGLHQIVIAEIIAMTASVLAVIVSVLAFAADDTGQEQYSFGAVSIIMLVIVALYVAAYILEIFGIFRASKDEPAFKVSLYAILSLIAVTVLSGFFYENETASFIIALCGDVAQFFLVHYIIHGIMHLSHRLGRSDVVRRGTRIFRVIYTAIVFEIIVRVFEIIFGQEHGEALAMPFDVIANLLKTAEYILFMLYIIKGYRLIKNSKASGADSAAQPEIP